MSEFERAMRVHRAHRERFRVTLVDGRVDGAYRVESAKGGAYYVDVVDRSGRHDGWPRSSRRSSRRARQRSSSSPSGPRCCRWPGRCSTSCASLSTFSLLHDLGRLGAHGVDVDAASAKAAVDDA